MEFGNSDCRASNCNACGWKRSWPDFIYYLSICLESLNKVTNLRQCNLFAGRGLNLGPPEYEARVKHSAMKVIIIIIIIIIIIYSSDFNFRRRIVIVAMQQTVCCVSPVAFPGTAWGQKPTELHTDHLFLSTG